MYRIYKMLIYNDDDLDDRTTFWVCDVSYICCVFWFMFANVCSVWVANLKGSSGRCMWGRWVCSLCRLLPGVNTCNLISRTLRKFSSWIWSLFLRISRSFITLSTAIKPLFLSIATVTTPCVTPDGGCIRLHICDSCAAAKLKRPRSTRFA